MAERGLFFALKELSENNINRKHVGCKLYPLYIENTEESKMILEILDNKEISAVKLAKVLKDNGIKISVDSLRRHRNRKGGVGCQCP